MTRKGALAVWSFAFGTALAVVGGVMAVRGALPSALTALSPWEVALIALASFRLTRIIAREEVGAWVRALVPDDHRHPLVSTLAALVRCPFCLGVWVAAFLTSGYLIVPQVATLPLLVLAVAGAALALHVAVAALQRLV